MEYSLRVPAERRTTVSRYHFGKNKRTLIVCEGPGELLYLRAVIKLSSRSVIASRRWLFVRSISANGRDKVLSTVQSQLKRAQDPYASVYVVMDTENRNDIRQIEHRFETIVRRTQNAMPEDSHIFWSHPSIERWFLLHFEDSTRAFSSVEDVIARLKVYYPQYGKDAKSIKRFLSFLYPAPCFEACLRCALERAQRLEAAARSGKRREASGRRGRRDLCEGEGREGGDRGHCG